MQRSRVIPLLVLSTLTLAGCGEATFGESLRAEGLATAEAGARAIEGERLIDRGQSLLERGRSRTARGSDEIAEGQRLIAEGEALLAAAREATQTRR